MATRYYICDTIGTGRDLPDGIPDPFRPRTTLYAEDFQLIDFRKDQTAQGKVLSIVRATSVEHNAIRQDPLINEVDFRLASGGRALSTSLLADLSTASKQAIKNHIQALDVPIGKLTKSGVTVKDLIIHVIKRARIRQALGTDDQTFSSTALFSSLPLSVRTRILDKLSQSGAHKKAFLTLDLTLQAVIDRLIATDSVMI